MTGTLLTQATTPIIGQIAWLLGKLMDGIFNVMSNLFGIENIGICIIIFTIIIYTLLIPLTIKQQKFSKMSAAMNPEIQAIQKKYKGKRDQTSVLKMQEETQMVYDKYGTSPTGGCGSLLIQFPILLGLWQVIQNIPAYVGGVKDAYLPLVNSVMATDGYQKIMEGIGKASPILIDPKHFDYTKTNTIIDVLYKFQDSTWDTLADKFSNLQLIIQSTQENVKHLNSFLGINLAETPKTMFMDGVKTGAIALIIVALIIPILSGLTQWISIKLTSTASATQTADNPMASQMKMMNVMMPMLSVFMCFTFQAGLGLYWIASAVVRCVQQLIINKHLEKISVDDLIAQNVEKVKKKREKKGASAKNINEMAQRNVRNIQEPSMKKMTDAEKEARLKKAAEANKNAKAGSLASKANMVKNFNENN